jgi:hypothetical protein
MVRGIHNNNPYLQNIAMAEELSKASKEKLEKKPWIDPSASMDAYSSTGNKVQPSKQSSSEEGQPMDAPPENPQRNSENEKTDNPKPPKGTLSTGSRIDIRI